MNQNKIIQATQIDERHIADIYRLPCVKSINKLDTSEEFVVKGYSILDEEGLWVSGYFAAFDTDWLCQLQYGTWEVLTDEQYKEIVK